MLAFIIRRLAQAVLVMLAVGFVAFSMFRYIGDPVGNMMGQEATLADRAEATRRLGLDQPVPIQFARFLANAARGEFGVSYRQARKVSTLIAERLPATLELALFSAVFALAIGIGLGVYTALHRDGLMSRAVMVTSLIGVSLPTLLIGIGLIYLFEFDHWYLNRYR